MMVTMKRVVTLAMASVLLSAAVCVDRVYGDDRPIRWGSGPLPRAGVCFFENTNFQGQYFCVDPGEELAGVPLGLNDTISSFRIIGNVEVIVFKDVRFSGASGRFATDVRDLRREGWNDLISSLRVTNASFAWDGRRAPVWSQEAAPAEGACFYQDVDFRGAYFCVPRGASYTQVPPGFNDQVSSIRVNGAGGVLVFQDFDFGGRVVRITSDVGDLRRGIWNDSISSIRVF